MPAGSGTDQSARWPSQIVDADVARRYEAARGRMASRIRMARRVLIQ